MSKSPLALTCGDPAGIGPELIASWLKANPTSHSDTVVIGPTSWLKTLGLPSSSQHAVGPADYQAIAGKPDDAGSATALAAMETAADGVKQGKFRAVVTGPINKKAFSKIGYNFPGQTEFFAHHWAGNPVMAFAGGKLTVGLVTWHIPLEQVAKKITGADIRKTVLALIHLRKKLGDKNPRIAVCGINPHAGENGLLGSEDDDIIRPAVESLRAEGYTVSGPLPGDTVFYRHQQGEFDAVAAIYHDQGLAPLKLVDFSNSANLTLGLKYIRTSPDHGTAYEIAGKNQADRGSFDAAVKLANALSA